MRMMSATSILIGFRCGLLSLSVGLVPFAVAQAQTVANVPYAASILWEVDPGMGVAPSYVLGTMHVSDPRGVAIVDAVEPLVTSSSTVAVELVVTPAVQMEIATAMMSGDGPSLDAVLGPEDFAILSDSLAVSGIPAFAVSRLQPWAATVLLSMPEAERERLAAGAEPVDVRIQRIAEAAGISVIGLETSAEQLAVLGGMSREHQIEMLQIAIDDLNEIDGLFDSWADLYADGDLAALYTEMLAQMDGGDAGLREEVRAVWLDARNALMAERAEPAIRDGGAFIAVGALHLPGVGGVIERLAAAGFAVAPVALTVRP